MLKLNPGVLSLDLKLHADWENHQAFPNVEREMLVLCNSWTLKGKSVL